MLFGKSFFKKILENIDVFSVRYINTKNAADCLLENSNKSVDRRLDYQYNQKDGFVENGKSR